MTKKTETSNPKETLSSPEQKLLLKTAFTLLAQAGSACLLLDDIHRKYIGEERENSYESLFESQQNFWKEEFLKTLEQPLTPVELLMKLTGK